MTANTHTSYQTQAQLAINKHTDLQTHRFSLREIITLQEVKEGEEKELFKVLQFEREREIGRERECV